MYQERVVQARLRQFNKVRQIGPVGFEAGASKAGTQYGGAAEVGIDQETHDMLEIAFSPLHSQVRGLSTCLRRQR